MLELIGDFLLWLAILLVLGIAVLHWLLKHVTPTIVSTVSLSVSQGVTGTAFNLVIVSTENGSPDTTDVPVVVVEAPDGTDTTLANVGAPDSTGTSTTPLTAGSESGAYIFSVTVGGDVQPSGYLHK